MIPCYSAFACDKLLDQRWLDPDEEFIRRQQQDKHNSLQVETGPMTIGVGVVCANGIVLATDSEYTIGGQIKIIGPKLFTALERDDVVVIAAGAGRVPFMKRAVEEIGKELQKLSSEPSNEDVRFAVEQSLRSYYALHVFTIPSDIRPTFDLLFAVWTYDGYKLLSTDITDVTNVDNYDSIGIGQHVSHYAIDLVRNASIGLEQGKFAAAYCIKAAKDYVRGCGKPTRIWTLDERGKVHKVDAREIADLEEYCDDLTNALSFLNVGLDLEIGPAEIETLVADFRNSIEEYKAKQKRRIEVREKAARRRAAREQGHPEPPR